MLDHIGSTVLAALTTIGTALGIAVLVIILSAVLCVGGGILGYKVLEAVARRGFYLGACRRLAAGTGDWNDLDEYLSVQWSDKRVGGETRETYVKRVESLYAIVSDVTRSGGDTWRPDLPPAMYRWVNGGHSPDLLFDAIDAGYGASTLDTHRTGGLTLDPEAVQTLIALRA